MKKTILSILALIFIIATQAQDSGKAFERKNMYNLFGIGGQYYWVTGSAWRGYGFAGRGLSFQYQAEWGIHDYVGLGFHVGATSSVINNGRYGGSVLYIPVGVQANFHFYQLIDDKVSSDIHSDKLDIYAGVNVGGGPIMNFYNGGPDIFGGLHAGTQLGIRYYPKSNFGIFAEVGYGKSFGQFGIVIR